MTDELEKRIWSFNSLYPLRSPLWWFERISDVIYRNPLRVVDDNGDGGDNGEEDDGEGSN
ncbi:MAG: hypothetical protein ACRD5J_16165 [Nitrososphaeraceae archaeon]